MSADAHGNGHDDHGHGTSNKNEYARSPFYTTIAVSIVGIFLLIFLWILIGGKHEGKVIQMKDFVSVKGTIISEDAEVNLQNEMEIGQYHYYTLMPGVTFKANDKPSEYYPYHFPAGSEGLVAVDDQGNTDLRWGTLYVVFTNTTNKPITMAFGRCSSYNNCTIDFSNSALEAGVSSIITSETNESSLETPLWWLTLTALFFIGYTALRVLCIKFKPELLVKKITLGGGHHDHHGAHDHGHGHGHGHDHEADKNGFNFGFLLIAGLSVITGIITLVTASVYNGMLEQLYALFPGSLFAYFTYQIYNRSISVDVHVIKGIYSKMSKKEIVTLKQGDGFVIEGYIIGTPASQGLADLNLDNYNIDLQEDKTPIEILLGDNNFVKLRKPRGFFRVDPTHGTNWLNSFPGGTVESLNTYIKETYLTAVAIVAPDMNLGEIRRKVDRNILGVTNQDFAFCDEIDKVMLKIFKRDKVYLLGHTTMAQPEVSAELRKALQLKGVITEAVAAVEASYPGLSAHEKDEAARIWAGMSQKNYQMYGLDKSMLPLLIELVKEFKKKK